MAKIFELFPKKIVKTEELENEKEVTENTGVENVFDLNPKNKLENNSKLGAAIFEDMIPRIWDNISGVITKRQMVRLSTLKKYMLSVKGNYSHNAYSGYYKDLDESQIEELAPILDNLSDKDFMLRPAYAWALINVLEKKILAEAFKKKN